MPLDIIKTIWTKNKKHLPSDIKKILLVQLAGIGDLIMAIPAINAIRNRFPQVKIVLLTTDKTRGVIAGSRYIDEIISIDYKGRLNLKQLFKIHNLRIIKLLRRYQFDLGINLYQIFTLKGAFLLGLFFKLINVDFVIGRDTGKKGFFLNMKIDEEITRSEHEVESNLDLARMLGAEVIDKNSTLDVDIRDIEFIISLLENYGVTSRDLLVGIGPGSSSRISRRWLKGRFAQLADEIIKRYSAKIVFTGSQNEIELADKLISLMKNKPINTTGKLNLSQLKALIKRCNLYICNDSGPMHIASALQTPLVAIFGPGYLRYAPYANKDKYTLVRKDVDCSPCYKNFCNDHRCMKLLTVEDVMWAVDRQLRKSGLI